MTEARGHVLRRGIKCREKNPEIYEQTLLFRVRDLRSKSRVSNFRAKLVVYWKALLFSLVCQLPSFRFLIWSFVNLSFENYLKARNGYPTSFARCSGFMTVNRKLKITHYCPTSQSTEMTQEPWSDEFRCVFLNCRRHQPSAAVSRWNTWKSSTLHLNHLLDPLFSYLEGALCYNYSSSMDFFSKHLEGKWLKYSGDGADLQPSSNSQVSLGTFA